MKNLESISPLLAGEGLPDFKEITSQEVEQSIPFLLDQLNNKFSVLEADLKSKSKGQVNKADIIMSALNGQGQKEMIQAILNISNATEISEIDVALNERQLDLVALAVEALEKIDEIATQNLPWDFWTIDLREAIYKLGELTGEEVTEEIHKRIFSKFCIGK